MAESEREMDGRGAGRGNDCGVRTAVTSGEAVRERSRGGGGVSGG